jgi:thymidylate synthase
MKEYLDVLQKILDEGVEKESGRANMPNTIGISKADIGMNLSEGFPLLTTKKVYWKGVVHELLWFLNGGTNIKYLVDNNVNIWNGDAYRWYLKWWDTYASEADDKMKEEYFFKTQEEFIQAIKDNKNLEGYVSNYERKSLAGIDTNALRQYTLGDLGKVYGAQWRNQNGVDQVKDVVDGLKKNPYSRYHIIDGWNKADFPDMALPPCHLLYQFIVRPLSLQQRVTCYFEEMDGDLFITNTNEEHSAYLDNAGVPKFYLDLNMYQRSCDTFLGVPFNIASMSLLLTIMAEASNMIPGVANWIGGDTHMYVSHLDAVNEQLSRTPTKLPRVKLARRIKTLEDICNLKFEDIVLIDYYSQDSIKAELFTGLKKK